MELGFLRFRQNLGKRDEALVIKGDAIFGPYNAGDATATELAGIFVFNCFRREESCLRGSSNGLGGGLEAIVRLELRKFFCAPLRSGIPAYQENAFARRKQLKYVTDVFKMEYVKGRSPIPPIRRSIGKDTFTYT
eukprot:5658118-Pleurochrysis_carterae.AAC.3